MEKENRQRQGKGENLIYGHVEQILTRSFNLSQLSAIPMPPNSKKPSLLTRFSSFVQRGRKTPIEQDQEGLAERSSSTAGSSRSEASHSPTHSLPAPQIQPEFSSAPVLSRSTSAFAPNAQSHGTQQPVHNSATLGTGYPAAPVAETSISIFSNAREVQMRDIYVVDAAGSAGPVTLNVTPDVQKQHDSSVDGESATS